MLKGRLLLRPLAGLDDFALLAARVGTGAFLIDGVWDNVTDPRRMAEFASFMATNGFDAPTFWAPFSVYSQLIASLLLLIGLLARWAALVIAATFAVALWGVHWEQGLREWWPALALILIGLMIVTRGAGRWSVDALLEHRVDKPGDI